MKFTQIFLLPILVIWIAYGCTTPSPSRAKMDQEKYRIRVNQIPIVRAPAHCRKKESSVPPEGIGKEGFPWILYGEKNIGVVLVHGFIASPAEVIHLAHALNRAGATVYLPLIPGFGGDANLANQAKLEDWKEILPRALEFMSTCFSSVHLMGFSLGGALVSDFVLQPDIRDRASYQGVEIRSVTLLAPYFDPKLAMTGVVSGFLSIFTDTFSLRTSLKFTGNKDLRIPIANPQYYNDAFPLKAVCNILYFGRDLEDISPAIRSNLPVFLGINEGDQTVDNDAALKFVEKHFRGFQCDTIPKTAKLPHQFMARGGHPRVEEMIREIIKFIEKN